LTATLRLISSEISGGVGAVKGVLIAAVSVQFPAEYSGILYTGLAVLINKNIHLLLNPALILLLRGGKRD